MTGIAKSSAAIILGLGMLVIALAGFWGASAKDKPMEVANNNLTAGKTMPLIDQNLPGKIATATFAMG